jgi:hypothetical protein
MSAISDAFDTLVTKVEEAQDLLESAGIAVSGLKGILLIAGTSPAALAELIGLLETREGDLAIAVLANTDLEPPEPKEVAFMEGTDQGAGDLG